MELAPSNAEAPRELARIYSRMGRFQEAEALFLQAARARPTDWYVAFELGVLYYQHEKYDQAEAILRKALALAPGNELVSRRLGGVFLQQGRYNEAIEELQTSLKIKSNAGTYLTLGATYFYQHRFKEAVAAAETALDLDSSRYYYWGNLGIYYKWTTGEEAKSAPALQKAIELAQRQLAVTPKDGDVRADLAEYRARLGDKTGALAEIASIPDAERQALASRLALAFELTGNRAKAIELIRSKLTNPASLTQIKDDPDLEGLWWDPRFQAAIPRISK
jgi:tetratricopeptide (TPR) repeat protein